MEKKLIIIVVVLLTLPFAYSLPQTAQAAGPWYVDLGGNDTHACTSPGTACLTINGALGKASPGDMIFVASGTYAGSGSEAVSITKNITLSGGWDANFAAQVGTSIVDGQDARRGIVVGQSVTVLIERFTIQNGRGDGAAGISNDGNLTLNKSTVGNNFDDGDWTSEGGGIRNGDHGTLALNNSTVKDNESSSGAGIFNAWGTIIINNSTISGNSARGFGGGINNLGGSAYLNNVTISSNSDNDIVAGGIHNEGGGSVYLKNTIIAKNNGDGPDCNGILTSSGYNLIGSTSGCTFTPTAGDLTGKDPLLGAIGDNGGPTLTHALQFGSPAINGGDPGGCRDHLAIPLNFDQRGLARVQNCDIGAFEFQDEIRDIFLPIIQKPIGHADDFNDNNLDSSYWIKYEFEPGISVQEAGGEIKVSGTSTDSIWAWSGLGTPTFPKQSFQVSVDFRLVNMTNEKQNVSLRMLFNGGHHDFRVGYWDPDDSYYMSYKDGSGYHHLASLPAFGDESSTYHRLRIVFDAGTNTANAYVDNKLIGSFTSGFFTGPMYLAFFHYSQIPGSFNVDCRFDNFKLAVK